MRADQVMTASGVTTTPETSVKEVVRLSATHSYATLPVVDEDGDAHPFSLCRIAGYASN
jgi:CBS domain-containing protein